MPCGTDIRIRCTSTGRTGWEDRVLTCISLRSEQRSNIRGYSIFCLSLFWRRRCPCGKTCIGLTEKTTLRRESGAADRMAVYGRTYRQKRTANDNLHLIVQFMPVDPVIICFIVSFILVFADFIGKLFRIVSGVLVRI